MVFIAELRIDGARFTPIPLDGVILNGFIMKRGEDRDEYEDDEAITEFV